jgi:hypothetical protein
MLITSHTITIRATPDAVWAKMIDFTSFSTWDSQIEWVTLDKGVTVGSRGKLKTKGNLAVPFWITEVNPQRSYTSVAGIGPMRMIAEHEMSVVSDGVQVRFALSSEGWGAWLHRLIYGRMMREGLPQWMENLKQQLERKTAI